MPRRDPQARLDYMRTRYGTVNVDERISDEIWRRAKQLGVPKLVLATALVEAALDAAGAPKMEPPQSTSGEVNRGA